MDFNNVTIPFLGIKRLGLFDGYQVIEKHYSKTLLRCMAKSLYFGLFIIALVHVIMAICNFIGWNLTTGDLNYTLIAMYGFFTERLSLETGDLEYEQQKQ